MFINQRLIFNTIKLKYMLSTITKRIKTTALPVLGAMVVFSSCNKDLDVPATVPPGPVTGNTIAAAIAASPNDSLFNRMLIRSGLAGTLNNPNTEFTLFAVDNAGMKLFVNSASGGAVPLAAPDATFSAFIANTLPAATAAGIISYLTLPQRVASSQIPTTFPNLQRPTMILLDPTNPLVRMSAFPSKNANGAFFNNVPITSVDQQASNGIIHRIFTVSPPPTALLKTMIANEPSLSYLRAAITRADSGQVGLNRFDSALNFGVANLTVFAPNDASMQTLVFGLAYSQAFAASGGNVTIATAAANAAVAAGPAIFASAAVTTQQMRGIIAYHLMGVRVFNCNMPTVSLGGLFPTLLNGAIPAHPGLRLQSAFAGPFAASFTATGLGTFPPGGAPYSGTAANGIKRDQHGVNGVYHIIDRVLLPQ
jgi:Fasciclin domain